MPSGTNGQDGRLGFVGLGFVGLGLEREFDEDLRWTPPGTVIVTIRESANYIRVLLYSYCTTITGGVHLMKTCVLQKVDGKLGKQYEDPRSILLQQIPKHYTPTPHKAS